MTYAEDIRTTMRYLRKGDVHNADSYMRQLGIKSVNELVKKYKQISVGGND